MDLNHIKEEINRAAIAYLETRILDKELIEEALEFFNQYHNLSTHPFTLSDVERLGNLDFALKLDFLHWSSKDPKTPEEIGFFYRHTPFEFFKNLYKTMDIFHYKQVLEKEVIPAISKVRGRTVLDYGGGSGYLSLILHALGYTVTFAEINHLSLAWMRHYTTKHNLPIKIIDLSLNPKIEDYDAILLKDVIEHVANPNLLVEELSHRGKVLLVSPRDAPKKEDYLPMHFSYNLHAKS